MKKGIQISATIDTEVRDWLQKEAAKGSYHFSQIVNLKLKELMEKSNK